MAASLLVALGFGLGSVLGVFMTLQLFNDPQIFIQTLAKSLGLGSVYAIIALGFVLIFKATQTVNFAQGGLAVAGALFLSFLVADDQGLHLLGSDASTETIYTPEEKGAQFACHEPRPLRARPRERAIPPRVDLASSTATTVAVTVRVPSSS